MCEILFHHFDVLISIWNSYRVVGGIKYADVTADKPNRNKNGDTTLTAIKIFGFTNRKTKVASLICKPVIEICYNAVITAYRYSLIPCI